MGTSSSSVMVKGKGGCLNPSGKANGVGVEFWHLDPTSVEGRTFSQAEPWFLKPGGSM